MSNTKWAAHTRHLKTEFQKDQTALLWKQRVACYTQATHHFGSWVNQSSMLPISWIVYHQKKNGKTHLNCFFASPNVSIIKIFRSRTFIFALGKERKKIDNKSLEGILVGFDEEKKGYRVYVPFEKRIIVSAHVKIDENTTRMLTWKT